MSVTRGLCAEWGQLNSPTGSTPSQRAPGRDLRPLFIFVRSTQGCAARSVRLGDPEKVSLYRPYS